MPPTVRVISTGGTIASTAGTTGATPSKSGEELVASVPGLDEYAAVTVEQPFQTPSYELTLEQLLTLRETVVRAANEVDGIVVTHGTDTMEESAYFLDLTLALDVPVVLTGAQRTPEELSADGPANILTAVRAATYDRIVDGVYVAFDEELHAARDVVKARTSRLDAFESPGASPVATFELDDPRLIRRPGSRTFHLPVEELGATVKLVQTGIGMDASQIDHAIDAGADGIVLVGTGLGNVTAPIGNAVEEAIDQGIPVVVTTRCYQGGVAPVYGSDGGGGTLRKRGAILGDDLPASKARLKLLVVLERADDLDEVRDLFEASNESAVAE